jgi:dimeric dUTPase (all-alpha-NTP-PPase superfamily)
MSEEYSNKTASSFKESTPVDPAKVIEAVPKALDFVQSLGLNKRETEVVWHMVNVLIFL